MQVVIQEAILLGVGEVIPLGVEAIPEGEEEEGEEEVPPVDPTELTFTMWEEDHLMLVWGLFIDIFCNFNSEIFRLNNFSCIFSDFYRIAPVKGFAQDLLAEVVMVVRQLCKIPISLVLMRRYTWG